MCVCVRLCLECLHLGVAAIEIHRNALGIWIHATLMKWIAVMEYDGRNIQPENGSQSA